MNKYIVEKSERKYKKLEINVFKNITLISVSKKIQKATNKTSLPNIQMSFPVTKKKSRS